MLLRYKLKLTFIIGTSLNAKILRNTVRYYNAEKGNSVKQKNILIDQVV